MAPGAFVRIVAFVEVVAIGVDVVDVDAGTGLVTMDAGATGQANPIDGRIVRMP